ncbi:hypothetical protein HMPREF1870_01692 [Bacteroidales bacterium KA00344]|nr:hypothetical protein HMPREF1870_01692 [Bacteroidales bacterium KA00344]
MIKIIENRSAVYTYLSLQRLLYFSIIQEQLVSCPRFVKISDNRNLLIINALYFSPILSSISALANEYRMA